MKVKAELDKLDTVPQLGEKLAAISKLKGKEADAPQKQIVTKIVETSLSDIAERLKQNDFSGATLAVEAGLGYAKGDERLLEQKERIRQEQLAFERAEAKRIEVARQQAAQEELANRTAAVEVLDLVTVLDNYGDLQIAGEIKMWQRERFLPYSSRFPCITIMVILSAVERYPLLLIISKVKRLDILVMYCTGRTQKDIP